MSGATAGTSPTSVASDRSEKNTIQVENTELCTEDTET